MEAAITLTDLRLDHPRGGAPIVCEANVAIAPGEVVVIVGAAGVGTSRLMSAALGEVEADSGAISVFGRDVGRLRRSSLRVLRRRIGIVPQDLCLMDDRSAQLNVIMPLDIDGIPRTTSMARAAAALSRLNIDAEGNLPVAALSWSERQRVAVARALVRAPEIILADQPTSMQDAEGAELVCDALAGAARNGAAVVVIGRDPALRAIAEREGWRTLGLVAGMLRPLYEIALEGRTIEDLIVEQMSAPLRTPSSIGAALGGATSGSVQVDLDVEVESAPAPAPAPQQGTLPGYPPGIAPAPAMSPAAARLAASALGGRPHTSPPPLAAQTGAQAAVPQPANDLDDVPNVVQFPISARMEGVA